jgi:hypothetical protein
MRFQFQISLWKLFLGIGLGVLASRQANTSTFSDFKSDLPKQLSSVFAKNSKQLNFRAAYGQMPMAFEANEGQSDSRVRYIARGSGYSLFLSDLETVIALNRYGNGLSAKSDFPKTGKGPKLLGQDVLRLSLVGGSRGVVFEAQDPLPGMSHYFIGNNSSRWKTNLQQYSKVVALDVYPGIDMVYYGHQGQLEYDFRVKPGADPQMIHLQHQGADSASIDDQGNLKLTVGNRIITFKPPMAYQEDGDVKITVLGKYVVTDVNGVGFEIGDYDKTKILIIDPALDYSTYLGGNNSDTAFGVAVDSSGCAYVTGDTTSSNFPTTSGAYQTAYGTNNDFFVTKLNAAGSAALYSTYVGGSGDDYATGIAVDSSGCAYVTGDTTGNFPTTGGAY